MTLRARLALAFLAVGVILVAVFLLVGLRQQQVLTGQLDSQLASLARNAWRLTIAAGERPGGARPAPAALLPDGAFIGRFQQGALVTVAAAEGQQPPRLSEAELTERERSDGTVGPFTAPALTGGSTLRVVGVAAESGWVVVGLSASRVESAVRQLALAGGGALLGVLAVLGLLLWWVNRLGLRPIRQLTEVAERITRGELGRRAALDRPTTEAGRLAAAFNTMADARQDAEQALRRFVADASHELRTPLTTLRGYADLYAAGGVSGHEATADAMRRIGSEAERMSGLVDDLLLLASLDERRPLARARVDVAPIVLDAAADARAVQPERAISATCPEHAWVDGDAHRIRQIVTALVANALRHTPVEAPLELSASTTADSVRIVVRDGGPGIAPEHAERIFERFYRADPGRDRARGGSGLGLSIVRSLVEAHGGTVAVSSQPANGASFVVTLPAADAGPR